MISACDAWRFWVDHLSLGAIAFGLLGLAVGARPEARCWALAGLAFLSGAGIAFFHVGVEQHWWRGTAECHAPVFDPNASIAELRKQLLGTRFVPCDEIPWSLFGISMASYNALDSLGLAAASLWAALKITGARQSSARTRPASPSPRGGPAA